MDLNPEPDHGTAVLTQPPRKLDYSLTGEESHRAIERGLAEAEWYQCSVPRATMRKLLERRNGPAIRDTILWFALIIGLAALTCYLWGSWWAILPYLAYATLYASTSDSRWHEAGHGTAFKTDWMNNALYEIASFMVMRESTLWRWSHTRHHSDTIIVGRDPEIAVPRPPNLKGMFRTILGVELYPPYVTAVIRHCLGRMSPAEKTFIPESEFHKIYFRAWIYAAIYLTAIGLSIYLRSFLPVMLIIFPHIFGKWLMLVYGWTQHAGLAENVLDHRLNCRTVYMNPINRFLYWNMNYHVEHHMFPLVPYHALPKLHAAVKEDMPKPYTSLWDAWKEIVPAVLQQVKDPAHYVRRKLPDPKPRVAERNWSSEVKSNGEGWLEVCAAADLGRSDVIRFDYGRKTFALYRDHEGKLYATDGVCTHGNTHLADGLVKDRQIECPKHNGRFNLLDGSPARPPVCRGLATYPIEERGGRLWLNVVRARRHRRRASRKPIRCACPPRAASPPSSRKSRWSRRRDPSTLSPAITSRSISPPTTRSASATSTSRPPTPKCGNASMSSTLSQETPAENPGATTTPSPATAAAKKTNSASTSASPRRRRDRIAPRASAPPTCST